MDAEKLLRTLGATGKFKGFFYSAHMIRLAEQDPMVTTLITKRLYPDTAKRFGVSAGAVERNLRTVIHVCWKRADREFLDEVAGVHLSRRPTNSEFLDMTAAYLRRQKERDEH